MEDVKKLIEEEERRLKVGDPEFLKRHEEIMRQCDELEEGRNVKRKTYLTASEIAGFMGISKSKAYSVIRGLNEELKAQGYLTIRGKIPLALFEKKYYGFKMPQELRDE